MRMDEYLRLPAVSAGLLRTMIDECPMAAFFQSWMNPSKPTVEEEIASETPQETARKERGSATHGILLEGDRSGIVVIDPANHPAKTKPFNLPKGWTNDSIREARDLARLSGKIPILKPAMPGIEAMVGVAHEFIESLKDSEPAVYDAFQLNGGMSEVTYQWSDFGTPCKLRTDRRSANNHLLIDYKTTATSAHPDAWGRSQLIGAGYYLSAAFYKRGFKALFNIDPDYVFLVQEVDPPYLCSLVGCEPALIEIGARKISAALTVWAQCVRDNHWPSYPTRIAYPETPGWLMADWEEDNSAELASIWTRGLGSQP